MYKKCDKKVHKSIKEYLNLKKKREKRKNEKEKMKKKAGIKRTVMGIHTHHEIMPI
jgi:hypothetical protein